MKFTKKTKQKIWFLVATIVVLAIFIYFNQHLYTGSADVFLNIFK